MSYDCISVRRETLDAWRHYLKNNFHATHFITINFNKWVVDTDNKIQKHFRYRAYETNEDVFISHNNSTDFWDGRNRGQWDADKKIEYAENKIEKWNARVQAKVLGKRFYKSHMKDEMISMILFVQNVDTNLHYHGVVSCVSDKWKGGIEKKWEKFEDAVNLWGEKLEENRMNKKGEITKTNVSICRGGQIWLERVNQEWKDDWERIIEYSTRQEVLVNSYSHFIICGTQYNREEIYEKQ